MKYFQKIHSLLLEVLQTHIDKHTSKDNLLVEVTKVYAYALSKVFSQQCNKVIYQIQMFS